MDRQELLAAIATARPGVLAEMETMVSGGDRCRWSPDDPWPRTH